MQRILPRVLRFFQGEAVLSVALLLALISAFLVPPDALYLGYIDWDTLALLFGLMAVVKGFQQIGLFDFLGGGLLRRISTSRQMLLVLVFLPFVFSMLITNDVALLTFVPFGMAVLRMAKQERLLIPLAVLQTIAANLGSMLTPMGNPQNLYLYNQSGMEFSALCGLMLPYVLLSGVCLALLIVFRKNAPVSCEVPPSRLTGSRSLLFCLIGFALCLLSILKLLPPLVVAALIAVFLLLRNRRLLAGLDYALLGTFVAFFIFVGNMGRIDWFQHALSAVLTGRETLVAVLASQIISNVPAALLLSGFTDQWSALLVGCNLGGLGTLIASMASVISYKLAAEACPDRRGAYLLQFTLYNLLLLAVLLAAAAVL